MITKRLILGSRSSRLAMIQAERVAALLRERHRGLAIRIEQVQTQGDRERQRALDRFSGVGVFVKDLERALVAGRIDAAVHSLKDMPTTQPGELLIAAVPIREDWRDALVCASGQPLAGLKLGARIATGSPRRAAQLRSLRPDIEIVPIRGNVETRLRKCREQGLDGLVLSYTGLLRLGLADQATEIFAAASFLPAPGQGAIAVEARRGDEESLSLLRAIHDEAIGRAVEAERALLHRLGGGCHVPVAALALPEREGQLRLQALVCSSDGRQMIRAEEAGSGSDPQALAAKVAEALLTRGAGEILKSG